MLLFGRLRKKRMKRKYNAAILFKASGVILDKELYLKRSLRCSEVAKLICTNRTYLWEALHWRGLGFQDYLSKFRVRHFIQNAAQYRSMEKEEIAERCGFNDAKTLDKYLRQMFSISLSEYLKLMSRGESPT